jgi:hypothetical protein
MNARTLLRAIPKRSFSTTTRYFAKESAKNEDEQKYALKPDPEKWTEGSRLNEEANEKKGDTKTKQSDKKKK